MRRTITREFYIPKNSVKVAHKASDAVAYIYTNSQGQPCAAVFYGKQSKPVARHFYKTAEQRTAHIARLFEGRRAWAERKAEVRAASKKPRRTEVGTLYYTSWGYEQTNIDWFEVVELVGTSSARVRPVATLDASKGNEAWATGKSVPDAGNYTGPAKLVRVNGDAFKIEGHYAHRWDGLPKNWTAYA